MCKVKFPYVWCGFLTRRSASSKLMWGLVLSELPSYPMSATLCLTYSDAWPIPSGNMTRVFGPMPATLGGSCRGEPADGMMADRALRNTEPAVSISSDWFSLLHCPWVHRQPGRRSHRRKKNGQKRERKQTLCLWVDKEINWHRSKDKNSEPARVLFFSPLSN